MSPNGVRDPGNTQRGVVCFEESHVPGCPGAAGGEHELDRDYLVPDEEPAIEYPADMTYERLRDSVPA